MEQTLQAQYNLIKEGKGNKAVFLKSAYRLFPDMLSPVNTFEDTIKILKNRSIISEGIGGVVTSGKKQDWMSIFNENMTAYTEVSKKEKEPPKEITDMATRGYDYKDEKNYDNIFGEEFLKGYYTEMKDPKNEGKHVEELRQIVAKNLAKDINHYVKDGQFGEKGVGYTTEVPGLGAPKEPKGKYKSSGYGDMPKAVKEGLNEAKRPDINSQIKELEKSSQAIALEAKLTAIDEAIEKRKSKLALAESEELAEMIDQSMVKTLNKEIKELEKHKAKTQKIYEKMTGKAKEEVIDEDDDMMAY